MTDDERELLIATANGVRGLLPMVNEIASRMGIADPDGARRIYDAICDAGAKVLRANQERLRTESGTHGSGLDSVESREAQE